MLKWALQIDQKLIDVVMPPGAFLVNYMVKYGQSYNGGLREILISIINKQPIHNILHNYILNTRHLSDIKIFQHT